MCRLLYQAKRWSGEAALYKIAPAILLNGRFQSFDILRDEHAEINAGLAFYAAIRIFLVKKSMALVVPFDEAYDPRVFFLVKFKIQRKTEFFDFRIHFIQFLFQIRFRITHVDPPYLWMLFALVAAMLKCVLFVARTEPSVLLICNFLKFDELVKSRKMPFSVTPAKAGIQSFQAFLNSRLRGSDDCWDFLRTHQILFSEFSASFLNLFRSLEFWTFEFVSNI
jgi:hypothetical protein